jgi:hypothetical protein
MNIFVRLKRKLFTERLLNSMKKDKKQPDKLLVYLAKHLQPFDELMGWRWSLLNVVSTYITDPISFFFYWLKTSFQYAIFLWDNGQDWDYAFLLRLLRFKLQRKYDFFTSDYTSISEAPEVAKEIKEVIDLIDAYYEDDFAKEENAAHKAKWGEVKMTFDKDVVYAEDGTILGYKIGFDVPNAKTKEDLERYEKEKNELYDLERKQKQECWNAIWDKMKKAEGWWD